MGHRIVKQPSGKYAIWSTIVDDFIATDATREEIINDYISERDTSLREEQSKKLNDIMDKLDAGEKPCGGYDHSWQHDLAWAVFIHGDHYVKELTEGLSKEDYDFINDPSSEYNTVLNKCKQERAAYEEEIQNGRG